jgi:hypothetical protein
MITANSIIPATRVGPPLARKEREFPNDSLSCGGTRAQSGTNAMMPSNRAQGTKLHHILLESVGRNGNVMLSAYRVHRLRMTAMSLLALRPEPNSANCVSVRH